MTIICPSGLPLSLCHNAKKSNFLFKKDFQFGFSTVKIVYYNNVAIRDKSPMHIVARIAYASPFAERSADRRSVSDFCTLKAQRTAIQQFQEVNPQ